MSPNVQPSVHGLFLLTYFLVIKIPSAISEYLFVPSSCLRQGIVLPLRLLGFIIFFQRKETLGSLCFEPFGGSKILWSKIVFFSDSEE